MTNPLIAARNALVLSFVFLSTSAFGHEANLEQEPLYSEAYDIFKSAQQVFYKEKNSQPDDEFFSSIAKHGFEYKDPEGLGQVSVHRLGANYIFKVLHYETNKTFLYLDLDLIDPSHADLEKLIAKIHIDERSDAVLEWIKDNQLQTTDERRIPKLLSKEYIKEYWKATYEHPTIGDLNLAMVCAVTQVAVSLCMASGKSLVLPDHGFQYQPAIITVFFALGIGINSVTYKNWAYRGSWLLDKPNQSNWIDDRLPTVAKRLSPKVKKELLSVPMIMRQSIASLAFAYILTAWVHEDGIASMNSVWTHLFLLGNVGVRNYAKKFWYEIPKIRSDLGLSNGTFKLKIPFANKKVDTKMDRQAFEFQMMYLVPFGIGVLDLISLPLMNTVAEAMPFMGEAFSVISSKAALFGMIPAAMYLSHRYAKKSYRKAIKVAEADPTRINIQRRDKLKSAHESMEKRWKNSMMMNLKKKIVNVASKCGRLFSRK